MDNVVNLARKKLNDNSIMYSFSIDGIEINLYKDKYLVNGDEIILPVIAKQEMFVIATLFTKLESIYRFSFNEKEFQKRGLQKIKSSWEADLKPIMSEFH